MKRIAKPIRWLVLVASYLLVATLAALGGAQLMRWWEPGYSTPLRSEFPRRLRERNRSSAMDEYRFFYATTRPRTADLLTDIARERSGELHFGRFDARISPEIKAEPIVWEDREMLEVLPPVPLLQDAFFDELRSAIHRSPHRSVLIVVWGWKERWRTSAAKSAYVSYLLDIDTPVVVFDWPANQGTNARGYLASHRMARASGADLGRLLEGVIQHTRPENLWLVALSMGSQVVSDGVNYMAQQPELRDAEQEIDHVILAAPDVAEDEFDRKFATEIRQLSRHLTVYVSSTDQALLLSQWINRRARVGRVARAQPENSDQPQFELGEALLSLQSSGSEEIEVVDVTPINRHRNRHNFLTDDPEFLDELYVRLLRPTDPISRRLYPIRSERNAAFWILWAE
jgi:esterase/lipase superfamily enzyme